MGQVLQAGVGQAPARQARCGPACPTRTTATTINRVCGSGLKAIMLAAAEIRAGDAEVVVAGGMESMNQAPYLLPRRPLRLPPRQRRARSTRRSTTACGAAIEDCHMGTHAERVAISDARQPRGPGRVRAGEPPEGDRGDRRRPVRRRDGAGHGPRREGPRDGRRASTRARAATRRAEALARLKPAFALPDGEDRGDGDGRHGHRRQRARASPTAPPRPSSPASAPSSGSA